MGALALISRMIRVPNIVLIMRGALLRAVVVGIILESSPLVLYLTTSAAGWSESWRDAAIFIFISDSTLFGAVVTELYGFRRALMASLAVSIGFALIFDVLACFAYPGLLHDIEPMSFEHVRAYIVLVVALSLFNSALCSAYMLVRWVLRSRDR